MILLRVRVDSEQAGDAYLKPQASSRVLRTIGISNGRISFSNALWTTLKGDVMDQRHVA